MTTIKSYKTPQSFLDDTEELLEQREIENNLILGVCGGFEDKSKEYERCTFINAIENNEIKGISIKTMAKAIVSGNSKNKLHIKALVDYYQEKNIAISGVVGQEFYAQSFAEFYNKTIISTKSMIVHQLTKVNELPISTGFLEKANSNDIDLVSDWSLNFQDDAQLFPKQSREQFLQSVSRRISLGKIFKWVDNKEVVSIAALVRQTKNIGIIGLVYTPNQLRGKGYATSCVKKLSEYILNNGFNYCGLFTDKSNPTSNHIYKKIGYEIITEFSDIEF